MEKEEAIKVAYGIPVTKAQHEALQFLIPELRESEDERIRKAIVGLIEELQRSDKNFAGVSLKDMLAWLEKQKEPENISASTMIPSCWAEEPSLQKEQKEIPLMNGDADLYFDEWNQQNQNPTKRQCFEEGMRYAHRLQKEQEPAEWSEDKDFDDCLTELACELYEQRDESPENTAFRECEVLKKWTPILLKKAQQKEEWSEEDVKTFWRFTAYIPDEELKRLGVTRFDILKKFKSLRPIKQEWSEEDRRHLDRIRMVLESWDRSHISLAGLPSTIPDDIDWLEKKLECFYPQPHWKPSEVCYGAKGDPDPAGVWKPSEEQMKALKEVAYSIVGTGTQTDVYLVQLYEQLKKLI